MTDARREDYWRRLDTEEAPLLDLLRDAAGEDWSVRGAAVCGESDDGETLFVLVLRHRVGDAGLIIRLGYATVSLDAPEEPVGWSDNYVDMRVQGCLPDALSLLFSPDGMGDTRDPLALDARPTSPEQDADILTEPWGKVSTVDSVRGSDPTDQEASDPQESVEHDRTPETVKCQKCRERIDREDAENFGSSAIAGDVWVCSGGCDS